MGLHSLTPPPFQEPRPARAEGGVPTREYAGFGYRVAAYLLDSGVALAAAVAAVALTGGRESWQAGDGETVFFLTMIAVWFVVTTVAMGVFRGQTLGKRLVGTRVVQGAGIPSGFGTSLLRDQLARLLYVVPLFFLVDSIWAAASEERQTLRDKMCSTHVVRESGTAPRAWIVGIAAAALLGVWVAGTSALDAGSGDEPGEGYSDVDRRLFVDGCTSEGATRRECVCLFEVISARVPYDEFEVASRTEDVDQWPKRMQDATVAGNKSCFG
jgi:uncharacterized RDD family membrane protein YckC